MLFLFLIQSVFAHSGRTNSEGCHNDNIDGGYHCHNGGDYDYDDTDIRSYSGKIERVYGVRSAGYTSDSPNEDSKKTKDYTELYSLLDKELQMERARVKALMDDLLLNEKMIKEIRASYDSEKKSLEDEILRIKKKKDELEKQELEIKYEKMRIEKEKIALKEYLTESKKTLYREEADDICGRFALKTYNKFKKNPKKYSNNLVSFAETMDFGEKCDGLDYQKLILPVLSNQKCGKFALQIQASYNSNKKYYGDLGGAAQHYSFNLYCPGIQYLDFIEEINDSSAKE